MISLYVTLCGALLLGLSVYAPHWLRSDSGVDRVAPGLLTVDVAATGSVTFGDGYTVSLHSSGLRIARYDGVMLDTVTKGSFLSVLTGHVDHRQEVVTRNTGNLHVTSLVLDHGTAVWSAVAYGPGGLSDNLHRVRIQASRAGTTMRVAISVRGADGLVVHLDPRPSTTGVPPAMPDRNLRKRAWWAESTAAPLFTNVLGSEVGLEAGTAARALDMSPDGVLDLHAWTSSVVLTASWVASPWVADS